MRSVDAINGEIGQLKHQIKLHMERIEKLYNERAEAELTAKGFRVGQNIELTSRMGKTRLGKITRFFSTYGDAVLEFAPILKNGTEGKPVRVHWYDMSGVKVIESNENQDAG